MARIRSIHPNTPADPDLAAIPIAGRLLFIYSWTVADDAGNLERSPRGMKMSLFPGDDSITKKKIEKLVEALIAGRFFLPYEVGGKAFLHVRSFNRYQKPDHPTLPRFPLYPGQSYTYHLREGNSWIFKTVSGPCSTYAPRTDGEHTGNVLAGREGKGKEGKGLGREGDADAPSPPSGGGGGSAPQPGNGNSTDTTAPQLLKGLPPSMRLPRNVNDQSAGEGNGRELPEEVSVYLEKLPEETRRTLIIQYHDFRAGICSREEATRTWTGTKVPAPLIAATFPPEVTQ